jgi:hypothetical protein
MSLEICIKLADGPDVQRHIGEIVHIAYLTGSEVHMRPLGNRSTAPVGSVPPAPFPDDVLAERELDVEAGNTVVDPTMTPSGGNNRVGGRRR